MLNSLKIENFRVLEDFQVRKLGHVNLIVGKNNSGKSTILEALRIYCSSNTVESFVKIANERGEPIPQGSNFNGFSDLVDDSSLVIFESYFSNRSFDINDDVSKSIKIGSIGSEKSLEIFIQKIASPMAALLSTNPQITKDAAEILFKNNPGMYAQLEQVSINALFSVSSSRQDGSKQLTRLDRNGGRQMAGSLGVPVGNAFLPTTLLNFNELANRIASIQLTDYKAVVIEALQFFDSAIEDYAVTRQTPYTVVSVRLKNSPLPVPLKSMGEGVAKIFQMMLSIPEAKGGMLLIDEFENGLHYSVQERVWNLIFDLTKKFNIQVFATTHSWDCIETFAKVSKERSEDGILFRVARSAKPSDSGKTIAIEYSEDDLLTMTKSDFEVR